MKFMFSFEDADKILNQMNDLKETMKRVSYFKGNKKDAIAVFKRNKNYKEIFKRNKDIVASFNHIEREINFCKVAVRNLEETYRTRKEKDEA